MARTRVIGLAKLQRRLGRVRTVGIGASHEAAWRLARDILGEMKSEAPVDTGSMREKLEAARIKRGAMVGLLDREARVVDYVKFVEYGTEFTPAQPFMRRSVRRVVSARGPAIARGIAKQLTRR